jgi:hypothetical protein
MVMNAALTGFWTRGDMVGKAQLRSQDVLLTLHPMPAGVVSFAEKVMDFSKWILGGVHRDWGVRGVIL